MGSVMGQPTTPYHAGFAKLFGGVSDRELQARGLGVVSPAPPPGNCRRESGAYSRLVVG